MEPHLTNNLAGHRHGDDPATRFEGLGLPRIVTVNGKPITICQRPGYAEFWASVEAGHWEPETLETLDRLLQRDWQMVDIGSWIGPLTLYAAQRCRSVDSYECDPIALQILKQNLDQNADLKGKVHVYEFGLGDEDGVATLYSRGFGNSETSLLRYHERGGRLLDCAQAVTCEVRDARKVFAEHGYVLNENCFIKIDVEGGEFQIVDRLRRLIPNSRCVWCVSVHELNVPGFCTGTFWNSLFDAMHQHGGSVANLMRERFRREQAFHQEQDRAPTQAWDWTTLRRDMVRQVLGFFIGEPPPQGWGMPPDLFRGEAVTHPP
jgi:FkbM family methyltransferase